MKNLRSNLSDLFSVVGAGAFIVAGFLFMPVVGWAVVGVMAMLFANALRE